MDDEASIWLVHNLAIFIDQFSVVYKDPDNATRVNVSRIAFFSFLFISWYCGNKTNQMWFSVVCTLIDNNTRHHSGQNVVVSQAAAHFVGFFFNDAIYVFFSVIRVTWRPCPQEQDFLVVDIPRGSNLLSSVIKNLQDHSVLGDFFDKCVISPPTATTRNFPSQYTG